MTYDDHTKRFSMNCFADCKLPHPLELLRLGGDRNWKRLKEKMLEFETNLSNNRRNIGVADRRLYLSAVQLRSHSRRSSAHLGEEGRGVSDVSSPILPPLSFHRFVFID